MTEALLKQLIKNLQEISEEVKSGKVEWTDEKINTLDIVIQHIITRELEKIAEETKEAEKNKDTKKIAELVERFEGISKELLELK
jgi:rRNA-processing protein FCF1